MNRRGFLTSLAALVTTAALPSVPSIPVVNPKQWVMKVACNSMYGKIQGHKSLSNEQLYALLATARLESHYGGLFMIDRRSAYPHELTQS